LVIYIDTSAFLKLVRAEDETEALQEFLAEHRRPLTSSVLLVIETRRAVLREDVALLPRADVLLTRVGQVGLDGRVWS
jgi:uncharacterized protein with PIN domain